MQSARRLDVLHTEEHFIADGLAESVGFGTLGGEFKDDFANRNF